MIPWEHFGIVVAVEFAGFVLAALARRARPAEALRILATSAVVGIPLGFCFDFIIGGRLAVFGYEPLTHGWIFLLANDALSYGIALATIWLVPLTFREVRVSGARRFAAGAAMALAFLLLVFAAARGSLGSLVLSGAAVLLLTEAVASLSGYSGVLEDSLRGHRSPLLRIWLASIALGLLYETANALFPIWRWHALLGWAPVPKEALIILFGYFVLAYPMALAAALLDRARSAPRHGIAS